MVEDPQKFSTIRYINMCVQLLQWVINERPFPYGECNHDCVEVYTALCILPITQCEASVLGV